MSSSGTVDATAATGLTRSQKERRQRILDAAAALAAKGGYDAVQMRDVADRADVALGTLYRYFPSKVHLLVSTMHQQTVGLSELVERNPPRGDTPAARVIDVLTRATRALQRAPHLTEAMTRALMFADTSAAREVDAVSGVVTDIIVGAMRDGEDSPPTDDELAAARVIEQVWWSTILAWLSGRSSAKQMTEDIEAAARLLLT